MLVETLKELLVELQAKCQRSSVAISKAQATVACARRTLMQAREQERDLVAQDERLQAQCAELRAYLNGLLNKPHVLQERLHELTMAQAEAAHKREDAGRIVRQQEAMLHEAEASVQSAEYDQRQRQQQYDEVADHLQRVTRHAATLPET